MSHRQELSTSPSYCCCCEPEFDPALLIIESRHDAPDSPSTRLIRVPSPLAWGRNNVRELHAQRRRSIITATPFSYSSTIGVPAANCCLLYTPSKYLVPGTWYVWSPYHTKKMKCSILHRAAHTILHSYKEVPKGSHKQKGQNVSISEPNKYFEIWHNNRPITNALTQLTFVHVTYVCGIAAHGYSNVTYVTCTFVVRTLVRGIGGTMQRVSDLLANKLSKSVERY